jgi:hypothetical protein
MNKRSLMVMMLIGLLGFGMIFGGCENGTTPSVPNTEDTDTPPATDPKVVAEKYRGTWKYYEEVIVLTETTFIDGEDVRTVYTVERELREDFPNGYGTMGRFYENDDTKFSRGDKTYSKQ